MTRVAERFSRGNLAGAFDANPLGALAASAFALAAVLSLLHLTAGLPIPSVCLSTAEQRRARWVLGVGLVANYTFVIARTVR